MLPHFLFKHVLWWLLRKLQLSGNTLKHFRNIINVPFAVITFPLICFFSSLLPFYFYNCKIKFHFFIFNMFSYEIWNVLRFFSYNNNFFCNFFKQFFGFINSYFSVFYIASLIKPGTWQFLHLYPQLFTSSKYLLSPLLFYLRFAFPFFSDLFNLDFIHMRN